MVHEPVGYASSGMRYMDSFFCYKDVNEAGIHLGIPQPRPKNYTPIPELEYGELFSRLRPRGDFLDLEIPRAYLIN